MIVKKNFNPVKVISYVWKELAYCLLVATLTYIGYAYLEIHAFALPIVPLPLTILGTALAIFVAFRNNSSYGRWWEACQIWGTLISWSRIYVRMIINFVDSEKARAEGDTTRFDAFKKEMVYRQIAFVHALCLHLRQQDHWHELQPFLDEKEYQFILKKHNKPNYLLQITGDRIRTEQGNGLLQWFHSFQIEGALAQFANH